MDKGSTFTGLAAVLFAAGLVVMFIAMFHEGSLKTALIGGLLFAGAIASWIWSARLEAKPV